MADDGRSPAAIEVGRLEPQDAAAAAELYAASHAEYPGWRRVFPDRDVRVRALRPFMEATCRDAALHGRPLVARDDQGIVGVAMWMPPGAWPLSAGRMARMTPALLRVALAAPRSFPAFARIGSRTGKAHPGGRYWYLQAMGVHPRAQRRGVGKRLINPVLAEADDAGLPCYLQTSDPANIDYYRRFGFELVQPNIPVFPDGPGYIGMTRQPVRDQER
jgi:ribosomal protein S18 acetylase RimI-like enzyme